MRRSLVKIADLRSRITIEQQTSERDGWNGNQLHWTTLAVLWAKVDQSHGSEKEEAARETAIDVTTFTVRYRKELNDTSLRIKHNDKIYDIESVIDMENMRRFMLIRCKART